MDLTDRFCNIRNCHRVSGTELRSLNVFVKRHPGFQGKVTCLQLFVALFIPSQVVLIQVALRTIESNEFAGDVSDGLACANVAFLTLTY